MVHAQLNPKTQTLILVSKENAMKLNKMKEIKSNTYNDIVSKLLKFYDERSE